MAAGSAISLAQPASPLAAGSLAQLSLSLLAILAFIFALSWAVKRLKLGTPKGRGAMVVLDQLALGPRERIVLVRVGEAQVLLGVAAGSVVGLTPLAAPLAIAPQVEAPAFAERLRELMKRSGRTP